MSGTPTTCLIAEEGTVISMAEPQDEESRKADIDWLYRRLPDDGPDPLKDRRARITSTFTESDIERREQEFLAQRARGHRSPANPASPRPNDPKNATPSGHSRNPSSPVSSPAQPLTPRKPPILARPAALLSRGKRKTRHPIRRTFITLLVLVVLWLAYIISVPIKAWADMPEVAWKPAASSLANQPGTAILLVGSDSRSNLDDAQAAQLGVGDAGLAGRTDTIMILYVPPHGQSVLISVPRDSYVEIPGYGKNKVNAAYAYGGAPLLVQTLENTTGLKIDGYMEIGFEGFTGIVNAVNGIQVCLNSPMVDANAAVNLPAGCQTLDGNQALGYVRERDEDPLGDLGRAQRQREVVTKVGAKLKTPETVLNPFRWWQVNMALGKALAKGKDTGPGTLLALGNGMMSIASGKGMTLQVPVSDPNGMSPDGQSIVIWDQAKAQKMFSMLEAGDTSQMSQFAS